MQTSMQTYKELGNKLAQANQADPEQRDIIFTRLINKLKPGLINYIYRLIQSKQEANDVFCVVASKMWYKLHTFKPEYQISTWAYGIAYYEALNEIKRKKRTGVLKHHTPPTAMDGKNKAGSEGNQSVALDYMAWKLTENGDYIQNPEDFKDDELNELDQQLNDQYQSCLAIIDNLDETKLKSTIMRLRFRFNYSYKDIAHELDLPMQTVKNRIRIARIEVCNKLRQQYGDNLQLALNDQS